MIGSHSTRRAPWSAILAAGVLFTGASAQTSKMTVMSNYNRPNTVASSAGTWGWTSPVTGKEYALMTIQNPGGLCVIDISDPAKPVLNSFISGGHNSLWYEVNAYRNYVYVVSQEGSMGLMIVDMNPVNQGLPAKLLTYNTEFFRTSHTLYVDTTVSPARLYCTYELSGGIKIFSLADPAKPVQLGPLMSGETHDMYARGKYMYRATQRRGTHEIWDVSNPNAPVRVSSNNLLAKSKELGEVPANGETITHNSWLSEDGKTLFTTEEVVGTSVKSWDITNPAQPRYLGKYLGVKGVIAHNLYVKGNKMYVGHYTGGLRIVDITDPANMKEIAYHRSSNSNALYAGTWGGYFWFKSGYIIHGDMQQGLFVMRDDTAPSTIGDGKIDTRFGIGGIDNGMLRFQLPRVGDYALSIFSPSGREVFSHRALGGAGLQTLALEGGKLSGGNYLVRLRQDDRIVSSPIALRN